MLAWEEIKFFYQTMLGSVGSILIATSTDSTNTGISYDATNIYNMNEVPLWLGDSADTTSIPDPLYITYKAVAGEEHTADYLMIQESNLATLGATVSLERSSDDFSSDVTLVETGRPLLDTIFPREFQILANGDMEVWSDGTNVAPDGWTLSGGGASVSRDGINFQEGAFSAALVRSGADAKLTFAINNYAYFQGKTITVGVWAKTSSASQTSVGVNDGVGGDVKSSLHTGGGDFEFLTVTYVVDASATKLEVNLHVDNSDGTVNFDGVIGKNASSIASTDKSDYIQASSNGNQYWRLKIAGHTALNPTTPPFITIGIWGDKTLMGFPTQEYDPDQERVVANRPKSEGGVITGIHEKYAERQLLLGWTNRLIAAYTKLRHWWGLVRLGNFFVGYERGNNPDEVWLMRSQEDMNNPLTARGRLRRITLSLMGRKL